MKSVIYLQLFLLFVLFFTASCTIPEVPSSSADEVNIVEAANLRETTQIGITQLSTDNSGTYEPVATINDPAEIAQIIETMDTPTALGPVPTCMHQYKITFQLGDQTAHEFGYFCADGSAFLIGGPPLEEGYAMTAPITFQIMMEDLVSQ